VSVFKHSVLIERPIEEVFAFLHDPANDPVWQTSLVESKLSGPMGLGATLTEVRRFLGRQAELTFEITEYEPPTRSSMRAISGPVPMTAGYILEPAEGGTQVTMVGETDAHGFFRLAEPVFARMASRELEANAGHLKDLLEATSS
jgi:uncharacterized protein YndB with AHSA1/START domain